MRRVASWVSLVLTLLLLAPFQTPAQAVSAGVGVVQNGLVLDIDPANYNGVTGSTINNLAGTSIAVTNTGVTTSTSNGNTFVFDSLTHYLTTPMSNTDFNTNGFSVTFYAKFNNSTSYNFERIIDFATDAATCCSGANNDFWVGQYGTSGNLAVEVWSGTTNQGKCVATGGSIKQNVFAHYAVVVNGTDCYIYVDGVSQTIQYRNGADGIISGPLTVKPVAGVTRNLAYIGKSNWSDAYFNGEIGELAVYNRGLSSSDVAINFAAQTDITPPTLNTSLLTQSFSMTENSTSVGSLSGSEVGSQFEMLTGADSAKFSVTAYGGASTSLAFIAAPNFESPGSTASSNTYTAYILLYDSAGNWKSLTITVDVTNVAEYGAITTPTLSATPYKGISLTITVSPTVAAGSAAGKVSYFVAGKRIPGCYKKVYVSGNSTCTWKPPSMGLKELTVTYTPTNTEYAASTVKKSFQVIKRTIPR